MIIHKDVLQFVLFIENPLRHEGGGVARPAFLPWGIVKIFIAPFFSQNKKHCVMMMTLFISINDFTPRRMT